MKKLALLAALGLSLQTSAQPIDWLHPKFILVRSDGGVFGTLTVNQETFGSEQGTYIAAAGVDAGIVVSTVSAKLNSTGGGIISVDDSIGIKAKYGTAEVDINGSVTLNSNSGTLVLNGSQNLIFTGNGPFTQSYLVGTAASGTGITAVYSGATRSWVSKVTVINTALTAAATTDISIVPATPVNSRIVRVTADVTQVFTGGALSAMTVTCGNAAGGTQYLLSGSVFTAQTTLGDVQAEVGAGLLTATWADFGTPAAGVPGALLVSCRFTCTGANCSAATQGSVTFYVEGVTY